MDFNERLKKRLDPNDSSGSSNLQLNANAFGALGLLGAPAWAYATAKENAPTEEALIDRAVLAGKYFNKDVDPRLKDLFLKQGGYGLQFQSGDLLKNIIPSTITPFVPADLSLAGKYAEQLKEVKPADYQADIITVTPGPNPARFATPELTPAEIGKGGAKGYIWGNPKEPQWGYAQGNIRKQTVVTDNPSIYLTRLNLLPEAEGEFKTTGEVVADPTLIENRVWGQRGRGQGDIYFPKESIQARGEVTAADLYTKIRNYGFEPPPITNINEPDKYLMSLANRVSQIEGQPGRPKPINQVLQETATPVPALGISERERGSIPIFKNFDIEGATPEQKLKAGIGNIFKDISDKQRFAQHSDVHVNNQPVGLGVTYDLQHEPSTFAGQMFRNINPLTGGAMAASAFYSPEVFEDLKKGQYPSALLKAGAAATTGALTEGAIRSGVVRAAQAGISWPARTLAVANPVVSSIGIATLAPGSSPQPEAVGTFKGSTVFRNPQGNLVAAPQGKPIRLGQATQGGKPTFVPWGSVAGTRVGPRIVGRPWWDVGQFFGR